jgi:hypothetical protein
VFLCVLTMKIVCYKECSAVASGKLDQYAAMLARACLQPLFMLFVIHFYDRSLLFRPQHITSSITAAPATLACLSDKSGISTLFLAWSPPQRAPPLLLLITAIAVTSVSEKSGDMSH